MPDDVTKERENPHAVPSPFAPLVPETVVIRTQRRLRYTGDGGVFLSGFPANPDDPEFELLLSDAELAQAVATGHYAHADAKPRRQPDGGKAKA
ncbi:MAG: hypothetical protein M3O91_07480 [Chloroflexota bacterium]|nr:hypothetical protein [Chloroflexota bacterium]